MPCNFNVCFMYSDKNTKKKSKPIVTEIVSGQDNILPAVPAEDIIYKTSPTRGNSSTEAIADNNNRAVSPNNTLNEDHKYLVWDDDDNIDDLFRVDREIKAGMLLVQIAC